MHAYTKGAEMNISVNMQIDANKAKQIITHTPSVAIPTICVWGGERHQKNTNNVLWKHVYPFFSWFWHSGGIVIGQLEEILHACHVLAVTLPLPSTHQAIQLVCIGKMVVLVITSLKRTKTSLIMHYLWMLLFVFLPQNGCQFVCPWKVVNYAPLLTN